MAEPVRLDVNVDAYVPADPEQRFPAVVRAADILLDVTREAV